MTFITAQLLFDEMMQITSPERSVCDAALVLSCGSSRVETSGDDPVRRPVLNTSSFNRATL